MISLDGDLIRLVLKLPSSASGSAIRAARRYISGFHLRLTRFNDFTRKRFRDARDDFVEYDLRQNLQFIPEQTSRLGLHMMRSSSRVLALSTIRCPQWILSRVFGFCCSSGAVILTLILVPFVLAVLSEPITDEHAWDMLGTFIYDSFLITIQLQFAKYAWFRLIATSDDLDKVFFSDGDRQKYIDYVYRWLGIARQSISGALCVSSSLVAVYAITPYMSRMVLYGKSLYVIAGTLTWLGANSTYWLWGVPQIIVNFGNCQCLSYQLLLRHTRLLSCL